MNERETVPCKTCGKPTELAGAKCCNDCWEVEHRLTRYLMSPGGREFVRKQFPKLDDWVDDKPDAWDYEAVLSGNGVTVEWCDKIVSDSGGFEPAHPDLCGWGFSWKHGAIHIGQTTEIIARKAAALFVSLWLRGVSASFADKLMDGYICFLERQENARLTFLAEIQNRTSFGDQRRFVLTRENFCTQAPLDYPIQRQVMEALAPQPDEEIIVTFAKRKKPHG